MPSLATATQLQILEYYFQGVQPPPLSTIYIALHNAAPGAGGTQSSGETVYSGYARVPIALSGGTFLVSQGSPARAQNLAPIAFPACSGTLGDTLAFWSAGLTATGPGQLITSGPIGNGTAYGFSGAVGAPSQLFVPQLPGILVNAPVVLYALGPAILLPGGFNDGQLYYVGTTTSAFITLSTALNNAAPVAAVSAGSGFLLPVVPLTVTQGVVPTFPVNSLLTFMD
jgi:hypothetical protein